MGEKKSYASNRKFYIYGWNIVQLNCMYQIRNNQVCLLWNSQVFELPGINEAKSYNEMIKCLQTSYQRKQLIQVQDDEVQKFLSENLFINFV